MNSIEYERWYSQELRMKRRKTLWITLLIIVSAFTAFWAGWYLISGYIPNNSILNMSFVVSRWWDILIVALLTTIGVCLFFNEKINNDPDTGPILLFGLFIGAFISLVWILAPVFLKKPCPELSNVLDLAKILGSTLCLLLIINLFACIDGIFYGLVFTLGGALSFGTIFGLVKTGLVFGLIISVSLFLSIVLITVLLTYIWKGFKSLFPKEKLPICWG